MQPTTYAGALRRRISTPVFLVCCAACMPEQAPEPLGPLAPPTQEAGGADAFQSSDVAAGERVAADRVPATTLGWNETARTLITKNAPNQQVALRDLAYLAYAQDSAATAVRVSNRERRGAPRSSVRGAIAAASASVLRYLFPADAATIEAQLQAERATAVGGGEIAEARDAGESTGLAVAAAVIERARTDGFDAAGLAVDVPVGPGIWFSSFTPARPPHLPRLGAVRPFFMSSGDQFRAPPPPAFGSPEFEAALAEVRAYSDDRTPENVALAQKWGMTTGSLVAGYWNGVAAGLVRDAHMSESAAAHAFALTFMAAWDANVACHDTKYTYWVLRPSQADAAIRPALALPNHPSYPSNHACLSGTAAAVLGAIFPSAREALWAQAEEAALSRVVGGLHYRFDGEAGLEIARNVSQLVVSRGGIRGRSAR